MTPLSARFDELKGLIAGCSRVVVAGHARADGDSVGAVAALRRHLEIEGKEVTALLLEPLSPRYAFMEFSRHYEVFDSARHVSLLASADVFIMCDLSSIGRLGPLGEAVAAAGCSTVCVDHHPCEDEGPADINLLDSTATASGRIAWDYIRHVGGRVDREIAEAVFVSLSTDTGWFRYSNTDASVLALAAELTTYRLDLPGMYRTIYQSNSVPMLRLLGHVTRSLNEECEGAFVWAIIRDELVRDLGVTRMDSDPILDVLRSAVRVSVVALFTEQPDRSMNVSLRSRGEPDVNLIARAFNGGGHAFAAGTTFEAESAERDMRRMVGQIRQALRTDR
jgi:bifunctional oligoribonuclease and PAP phosphatase NrnA